MEAAAPSHTMHAYLASILHRLTPDNLRIIEHLARKLATLQNLENPDAAVLDNLDLTTYIAPWLTHLKARGASDGTLRTYRTYVSSLLADFPHPSPINIDTYLALRSGAGISRAALAVAVSAIKSFFDYLTTALPLPQNPAANLKRPHVPTNPRQLPPTEAIARLLSSPTATLADQALLITLAGCGLRISEALTLRIADVNPDLTELQVTGKGRKRRVVPIPPQTAQAIVSHIADLPAPTQWLFPGRNPARPLTVRAAQLRIINLCERLGIPRITPHHLRHFYTSALMASGADLLTVSRLLGHATPDITARVYWHDMQRRTNLDLIKQHNPLANLLPEEEP